MKDEDKDNNSLDNLVIELSRIFYLTSLKGIEKVNIDILASETERKLLSIRCSLISLEHLSAQISVEKISFKEIVINGDIKAKTRQDCVVTSEPFGINIKTSFSQHYFIEGDDLDEDELNEQADRYDSSDILIGDTIDLGELVTQFLSLAIVPYPRSPEADSHMDSYSSGIQNDGPFAKLKTLINEDEV